MTARKVIEYYQSYLKKTRKLKFQIWDADHERVQGVTELFKEGIEKIYEAEKLFGQAFEKLIGIKVSKEIRDGKWAQKK